MRNATEMNTSYEYRSYVISHDGAGFKAKATDGENFQIRSKNMLRLTRAIDQLWSALEGKVPAPEWLFTSQSVNLDTAMTDTMLVIDQKLPSFPVGPVVGMPLRAAA